MLKSVIIGLIILLTSVVIFTTHYRLKINFNNHEFHDYLWIMGLKNGEKGKFQSIEYIFIKKSKVSQKMNSRASTTTIRREVYDGYLKFSEKDKIHLMTEDNKDTLIKKLNLISAKLQTKIIDYSEED